MFPNLKLQIFRLGARQNQLAKAIGMDETVLSKIIHGYRNPTPAQRRLLSSFLQADEAWLFEQFEASSKADNNKEAGSAQTATGTNANGRD